MLQRVSMFILLPMLANYSYGDLRADGHAPAGVMFEHMHHHGAMIGYRVQQVTQQGSLLNGGDSLSSQSSLLTKYAMLPQKHTMTMHMLDIMYALSPKVNVMIMPMYMDMGMTMTANGLYKSTTSAHSSHGVANHSHDVRGMGDTTLAAMYQVYKDQQHELIATLAFIAPTGDESVLGGDGKPVHYGMQLGAGLWQTMPNITYNYKNHKIGFGVQLLTRQPLEDENDLGVKVPDMNQASVWLSYAWMPEFTNSIRLQHSKTDSYGGHYNVSHNHGSPPDFQGNYGGEQTLIGLGANWVATVGQLKGLRVGVEYLTPINENLNGVQLETENQINFSMSKAF